MIIKMPDASVITRQRLANAIVTGNKYSQRAHSLQGSLEKKLEIYGDAYKAVQLRYRIIPNSVTFNTDYTGQLAAYNQSRYPTLPSEVAILTVTGISGLLDLTSFTSSGSNAYDSFWFLNPPSAADINACFAYDYTIVGGIPPGCVGIFYSDDPGSVFNFGPTFVQATMYVVILPFFNDPQQTYTLTVKSS